MAVVGKVIQKRVVREEKTELFSRRVTEVLREEGKKARKNKKTSLGWQGTNQKGKARSHTKRGCSYIAEKRGRRAAPWPRSPGVTGVERGGFKDDTPPSESWGRLQKKGSERGREKKGIRDGKCPKKARHTIRGQPNQTPGATKASTRGWVPKEKKGGKEDVHERACSKMPRGAGRGRYIA